MADIVVLADWRRGVARIGPDIAVITPDSLRLASMSAFLPPVAGLVAEDLRRDLLPRVPQPESAPN